VTTYEQRRLKYAATINDDALGEDTPLDYNLRYVDIGNVDSSGAIGEIVAYTFENAPSRARRIVRHGDVIVSTVRTYLQAIAPIDNPPPDLVVSTGFAVLRPRPPELDPAFCKYAVREPRFLWEVVARSVGVSYPAINASDLGDIRVHLPSLETQRRIADYLDRETTRIDVLIAAKQRLLDLLAGKRQAFITQSITRGLNPAAPLRDSGLPWLGKIPAHWELKPLRYVTHTLGGGTPDKGNAGYWQGDIPWISPKDMKRPIIEDSEDHISNNAAKESGLPLIPIKSVLIVVRGMILAHSFPVALTMRKVTINQDMRALVCRYPLLPEYLSLYFQGVKQWIVTNADESAHGTKKIESEFLGQLKIALPPIQEQFTTLDVVLKRTAKIDSFFGAMSNSLSLLRERRSALIGAAVTGQLPMED
jgi:type I restriction enzyme, S subunit